MAVTEQSYTGNGSTTNYSFTFPYLKSTDILVQVDQVTTTAWSLANATTIQFNSAPANGAKIKILRDTNVDNLTATFYAGSAIKSEDLNDNFTQNLYVTQEVGNRSFENTGTSTMIGNLQMGEDTDIVFEGATDNAHETTLTVADPTADRTITLPNVTGTVVTTGDTATVTATMMAANSVDSSELVDGSIDESHIAAGAVTNAKMASNSVASGNIVNDTIVNTDINSGAAIEFTKLENLDSAKILVGNGSNKATEVAMSGDATIDNTGAVTIAAGAIENGMMANNSVASGNIINGTIVSTDLADDSVIEAKIAAGAVTSNKLASNSVASGNIINSTIATTDIADDAITSALIADDAVVTAAIADDAITSDQIANAAVQNDHIAAATISGGKIATGAISATQLGANSVTVAKIDDAELTTLAGMQSATASILAANTDLTATLAEINTVCDGKSVQTTISDTDASYPTSGAVIDYVAAQIAPIGGLEVIADDESFPETQPSAGVIISIADAGGLVVNGSGVSTTGDTITSNATVTINGINSQFHSTTIAAGVGMQVSSTGSGQIYTYHKALLKEADLANLSNDINDFGNRYRVNAGEPGSDNDDGDLCWDTNADKMKVYDGTASAWKEVTSSGDFKFLFLCPAGGTGAPTFNGSIATYDLREGSNSGSAASVTNAGQLLISVNGVVQKPNSGTSAPAEGFALVDSNTVIFGANIPSNASVFVIQSGSALTINQPGDNTVSTVKIQNLAVNRDKIAADAIDGTKLADDAVGAEHIADNAVGLAAMASGTDGTIITYDSSGNPVAVGPGNVHDILTSQGAGNPPVWSAPVDQMPDNSVTLAKMAGGTDGQIITYDASGDPIAVGPGTDGQVLTSTGAGSPPAFEDLPASGPSLTGSTDNTIVTVTGSNAMQGEANLTFDGSKLHTKSGSSGQSTPVVWGDDLVVEGSGDAGITILSGNAADASLIFGDDGDADVGRVVYNHASNFMGFDVSAASRMKIQGTGNVEIADGDLVIGTSGHGISFAATAGSAATGASDTSELLDDYEEGTWTPYFQSSTDISGVTNYGQQAGRYVKIGRLVFCTFEMYGNSGSGLSAGSNDLWVKGRPFDMHGSAPNARGCCYLGGITNDTTYYMYFLTTEYYGDNGYIYGKNSGSNHGVAMGSALTDTSSCSGWFVYNAA